MNEEYSGSTDKENWRIETNLVNPTLSELTNTENFNKAFESSKSFEIDSTAFNFEQYFNLNFGDQCILIPGITGNQMIVFSLMQKGKIGDIFLGQSCLRMNKLWENGGFFSMPLHYMEYPPKSSLDPTGKKIEMDYAHFLQLMEYAKAKHNKSLHIKYDINASSKLSASEKSNGFVNIELEVKLKTHSKCGLMETSSADELCKYLKYFPHSKSVKLSNSSNSSQVPNIVNKKLQKTTKAHLSLKKNWVALVDEYVYVYQYGICKYIINLKYVNIDIIHFKKIKGMVITPSSLDPGGQGLPLITFISSTKRECADWCNSFFIARRYDSSHKTYDFFLVQSDLDKTIDRSDKKLKT